MGGEDDSHRRLARWYFGGLASAGAACCTHPLDLLKVHLQTQHEGNLGIVKNTKQIIKYQGVLALFNGLSASLLRQLTYSTTRFAIYEVVKQRISVPGEPLPFYKKVALAAVGGAIGGFIGSPADMITVRMQNDIILPAEQRRNYKHAFDGLVQVYQKEGNKGLFSGATMAVSRSVLMTIGQISFYDQFKQMLMQTPYFKDNLITHFTSSVIAGAIATTLTQPVDVIKTRVMNAKPGEYRNLMHCIAVIAKLGPLGFFKGYVPRFIRLAPHTILMLVFFEQLRLRFGYLPASSS